MTNDDRTGQTVGQGSIVTKVGSWAKVPQVLDKEDRSTVATVVTFFVVSFVLSLAGSLIIGVSVHVFRALAGV